METIETPIEVTPVQEPPKAASQPVKTIPEAFGDIKPMDDAAVRQAIAKAEAEGLNPETLTMQDFSQGQSVTAQPETPARLEVPDKFKKPDGTVDVEKLTTSAKQIGEAVQRKEEAVTKTVEDYLRQYEEDERKFRNLPNPEKLAQNLRQAPPPEPVAPQQMSDQDLRAILMRDYQADPLATTAQLIEIAIAKRLEPIEAEKRKTSVRSNIQELAQKDPRVLKPEIFQAITAKLAENPELWKLKNPHKSAWLEVKDEMQLGEVAQAAQAQPSRPPSPILGGGAPPSVPSSSSNSPKDVIANLHRLDPRDKKQEALGDAALRALLQGR